MNLSTTGNADLQRIHAERAAALQAVMLSMQLGAQLFSPGIFSGSAGSISLPETKEPQ